LTRQSCPVAHGRGRHPSTNVAADTAVDPLSLHDALPISASSAARPSWTSTSRTPPGRSTPSARGASAPVCPSSTSASRRGADGRSEEHTSELQSLADLVCRHLLEKKYEGRQPRPRCHLPY